MGVDIFSGGRILYIFTLVMIMPYWGILQAAFNRTGPIIKALEPAKLLPPLTTASCWDLLGKRLNDSSELALSFEIISTQADTFAQTNPNSSSYELIGPNVMNLSLNYSIDFIKSPGNRSSLSLGAGYYPAIVDYTDNVFYPSPLQTESMNEQFTGDITRGTIGISEQIQMGSQFGINFFIRGRYVNFIRVQA